MSGREEVEDPKETLEIQNVVASTAIGHELDLQSVAMDLEGAEFDPDQFPGLVYRIPDPHAATLIFRSGKIVCTGAESVPAVHAAIEVSAIQRIRPRTVSTTQRWNPA
jgi:transcription initiation factor TFIID TATA-box-binding protein